MGGMKTLKILMSYGEGEDNLYNAIEDTFGIEKNDIDKFLRKKLNEYSTNN
jgi:hypothetical protein